MEENMDRQTVYTDDHRAYKSLRHVYQHHTVKKIALKCTKYLLVAVLFALPFIGPKETEARAEAEYTQTEGTE